MNASSAKSAPTRLVAYGLGLAVFAVASFAMAALMSSSAHAQGAPVDLSPPTALDPNQPANQPESVQAAPLQIPAEAPTEVKLPAPKLVQPAIQVEGLANIDPDIIGVLPEAEGGFGRDLWFGIERGELENLLPKIPVTTASPAARDLMRRVLLSATDVPTGERGKLITIRSKLLASMGDFVGVTTLMNALPGRVTNQELLRIEVDTRLLTGDYARACELAQLYMADQSSAYWQKVFIFCQALSDEHDAAALGASLLREMGNEDAVFYTLIDHLSIGGEPPRIDSLPDPKPLHLALARAAKVRLPTDVIESNLPGVLRAIAISPNASPELRLEAAERAEVAGALPIDALRQLYASIQFSAEELQAPLESRSRRTGPMSRALLYRASLMQTASAAQAKALSRALDLARAGGRYASTARAFLPVLTRVPPSKDLAWFAPEAFRAFLITGRHDEAKPWFELLEASAAADAELASKLAALMPVARLSGYEGADDWDLSSLEKWWQTVKLQDGARERAALLASVFDAIGDVVPDEFWVPLIDGPELQTVLAPHPALWFRFDAAVSRANVGETILLALVIMGDGGPARAEPIVLHKLLKGLRAIGMEAKAREMALEAVVSAGL